MKFRISPLWWPLLGIASPILIPMLIKENRNFLKFQQECHEINQERFDNAKIMELPEVDSVQLDVLVEWKTAEGFAGDSGVSYLFKTNLGSLLYDVGYGPSNPVLSYNAKLLNFNLDQVDALAISHLHIDHMGGLEATRKKAVMIPKELMPTKELTCYLPDTAGAEGMKCEVVSKPQILESGIATTGPLARSLFFMGPVEEQALIMKLKGKGLVVFTGCGHPTIEVILKMVRKISEEPIYAIGGGLHFPIKEGRGNKAGIQFQTFLGTGKTPWQKLNTFDLDKTIDAINMVHPKKVFLSPHDSSDFALSYLEEKLDAETFILAAGKSYQI